MPNTKKMTITKLATHTAHDHNYSQLKMEHFANTNDSSNLIFRTMWTDDKPTFRKHLLTRD